MDRGWDCVSYPLSFCPKVSDGESPFLVHPEFGYVFWHLALTQVISTELQMVTRNPGAKIFKDFSSAMSK